MRTGALILAAGASSRLGFPKQTLLVRGETLLDRSVRIAREAGCSPLVVVLGAFEELIRRRCKLQGAVIASHPGWAAGMGTSLRRGLLEMDQVTGVVVMTCDMPNLSADHLRSLMKTGEITASFYEGRKGVPAYFPQPLFEELGKLTGDTGARDLLRNAPSIDLAGGEFDIDTPEDIERLNGTLG